MVTYFSQTFTSSGSWTAPANCGTVIFVCYGGGGSGGASGALSTGGGGAGGNSARKTVNNPSGTYTVTVGSGGTAPTGTNNGNAGGASQVTDPGSTVICKAFGGGGGAGSTAGNGAGGSVGAAGTGDVLYTGAAGATSSGSGNPGAGGGAAGSGGNASGATGGAADSTFGVAGGAGGGGAGAAGTAPGGGGDGSNSAGGTQQAGANGRVYAYWTVNASGTGTLSLTGSATGTSTAAATASGSLPLNGSASVTAPASASGSLGLTGSATGKASASGSGSLGLTGAANIGSAPASASGSLGLSGSGLAQAAVSGSGSLGFSGSVGASASPSVSGSLALTGSATGAGISPASGTGSLILVGNATMHSGSGVSFDTPGAGSWTATFTGVAQIYLWGGGGAGSSGTGLSHGGYGGGGGAVVVDNVNVVSGTTYTFFIGSGGTGGSGNGVAGTDGTATYWGDGSSYLAAGGHGASPTTAGTGGQVANCNGRSRIAGSDGGSPPSSETYGGGPGGNGASSGAQNGGAGGAAPGQNPGNNGSQRGGGGSGGGQETGGNGGNGGPGSLYITQGSDSTLPGYYMLGIDETSVPWTFSNAGTYDDFTPGGEGQCWVECVGAGGGGHGGNTLGLQGGHGGGGGAYAATDVTVHRGVIYRRVVGAGGAGGLASSNSAGTTGGDSYFTLTPLRVIQKQLTSNVATLWTYHPTTSTAQKHGLEVGDSVTVAGVDSTFNGTFTVTAVSADRLSFSYAKTAANVSATAVTPAANQVTRTNAIVLAKAGTGAQGYYTGGGPEPGGAASGSTGTITTSGGDGQVVPLSSSTEGGNGGGGALPLGAPGGWAGGSQYNSSVVGNTGTVPGGGGGGGQGQSGGDAGPGAQGAVVVRWILSQCEVYVGGQKRDVTRITYWTGGTAHTVSNVSAYKTSDGLLHTTQRMKNHPESLQRQWPAYLRNAYYDRFHRANGTFNWQVGAPHVLPAIQANDFDLTIVGDSWSEGWTYLNNLPPYNSTADFPNAFPRKARDYLVAAGIGVSLGGTGFIRCTSVNGGDPSWSKSGWTDNTHYISSSSTSDSATLTPSNTSSVGSGSQITGTKVAVITSGGTATIKIDGTTVATTSSTSGAGVLTRWESGTLSDAAHTVQVIPTGSGTVNLFGASVYKDTGVRVHVLSQGGSQAGGGSGQSYWHDSTSGNNVAPGNMTATFSQNVISRASKNSGKPNAVLICLGGNDDWNGQTASQIAANIDWIGQQFAGPNTDIIIACDVHTDAEQLALMDLCITRGWAMIDIYWLSRGLTAIFDQHYNGDSYGHLNGSGTSWVGGLVETALVYNPA